jgi:hypothetical protein
MHYTDYGMASVKLLISVTGIHNENSKYVQVYKGPENLDFCQIFDFLLKRMAMLLVFLLPQRKSKVIPITGCGGL